MGGLRQDVTVPVESGKVKTDQKLRFHEEPNTGQIHFHDDLAEKPLKASVAADEFWAAWRSLLRVGTGKSRGFLDIPNQSLLTLRRVKVTGSKSKIVAYEIVPTLVPIALGTNLVRLDHFIRPSSRQSS